MERIVLIIFCLVLKLSAYSKDYQVAPDSTLQKTTQSTTDISSDFKDPVSDNESIKFLSRREFWFGMITLVVLLILIPIIINLIRRKNINDELSVKLILTTIVIISTLFLVVAGYDDKTIAPAFGLFGAVLGYIFGRSSANNNENTTPQ